MYTCEIKDLVRNATGYYNGIVLYNVENGGATIYSFVIPDRPSNRDVTLIIPAVVQDDSQTFPVTGISGLVGRFEIFDKVTDRRRKTYGQIIGTGEFIDADWTLDEKSGCIIKEVVLPKTIKAIGPKTFYCNRSLNSINIPNGTEFIGRCAFWGCGALKTVTIPESVKEIDFCAFFGTETTLIIENIEGSVKFGWNAKSEKNKVIYKSPSRGGSRFAGVDSSSSTTLKGIQNGSFDTVPASHVKPKTKPNLRKKRGIKGYLQVLGSRWKQLTSKMDRIKK